MIAKNAPERPVHRTSPVLACRSNRFCRLAGANPDTAGQLVRCGIPSQKLQETRLYDPPGSPRRVVTRHNR